MDEIRDVILNKAALLQKGDAEAILAHYAPAFVEYSLAPPLRQPGDSRDPAPLRAWMATFEAPPRREVTQLEITTDGDVAFATSLDAMTAIPRGATEPFTLWFRVTHGLRRIDGRWLVTHEHESVPFEMDGSFRASIGLTPT
ncbi:ketosteroid isomerase-like protein [Actinoplanes lutulentus]|uniref:Ketosteroid isomerase-like protein n=1 Tax=Actinoplanes lutulentus TaxID=1287878 RepID=A0A327ZB73_9ACTN|nr:nuclear transport factor 2 family protein [Actinoplanes lutulentus]MBB2947409.1 ketosteroid isomerase-like protein [Actinoplanes lutulentus]RAK36683.1 ketosteroid isomerase-like protein [Actinoplanes lutulentus]